MTNYAYSYAIIDENGWCYQIQDTTNYCLDPTYVPTPTYSDDYLMKYYWPIPETVTSFDDWQGKWYLDAAHQNEATELND